MEIRRRQIHDHRGYLPTCDALSGSISLLAELLLVLISAKIGFVVDAMPIDANPFDAPPINAFMRRFNIPANHGSGIRVDLGQATAVGDTLYLEPSGRCPVYGKFIRLHQQTTSGYVQDFLADVPSNAQINSVVTGPLPGGFNNNYVTSSGHKLSPATLQELEQSPSITAKTALGKCAQFAYLTTAQGEGAAENDYKFPFVWDMLAEKCYTLIVAAQKVVGRENCPTDGDPPGRRAYCFEPMKDERLGHQLVYGSAYIGEHPDAYLSNCPNEAVAGFRFGIWEDGRCVDVVDLADTHIEDVDHKEACWVKAFEEAAEDDPGHTPPLNPQGWTFWKDALVTQTVEYKPSGGKGRNFGTFYVAEKGKRRCALSSRVPTCFLPDPGAVSYTSLGSTDEITPDFSSIFHQPVEPLKRPLQLSASLANKKWHVTTAADVGGHELAPIANEGVSERERITRVSPGAEEHERQPQLADAHHSTAIMKGRPVDTTAFSPRDPTEYETSFRSSKHQKTNSHSLESLSSDSEYHSSTRSASGIAAPDALATVGSAAGEGAHRAVHDDDSASAGRPGGFVPSSTAKHLSEDKADIRVRCPPTNKGDHVTGCDNEVLAEDNADSLSVPGSFDYAGMVTAFIIGGCVCAALLCVLSCVAFRATRSEKELSPEEIEYLCNSAEVWQPSAEQQITCSR